MKGAVWFAAVVLSGWTVAVAAQDKIYESTGQGRRAGVLRAAHARGDRDDAAASERNRHDAASGTTAGGPASRHSTGYSQLAILFPAEQGTMHTNTGAFDVEVALQPALNAGDAFVVTLDGTALPAVTPLGTSPSPRRTSQSAAADNVQHQLQVAVVDAGGNVLITAGPVSFYVHRAAVGGAR